MLKSVIIVEDDPLLREELRKVVDTGADIRCLNCFSSGEEALKHIPKLSPDIVLMDIRLPNMSGIQCVIALRELLPDLRIIMFTVYEDSELIFRALRSGASGYLLKSSPPEEIYAAIQGVQEGGAPMSSPIARKVVQHFHTEGMTEREMHNLSSREAEVLDLLSRGFIYKEIGDRLHICAETVRSHVKNICTKMHVRSRL